MAPAAELESQIEHSSLSLNEEKSLLEQIKQLKKARNSVGQLASQVGGGAGVCVWGGA